MKPKKYITQISASDMAEIAAATNPVPGLMLRVEKKGDSFEFKIDENAFKLAVWAFLKNGGLSMSNAYDVQGVSLIPKF